LILGGMCWGYYGRMSGGVVHGRRKGRGGRQLGVKGNRYGAEKESDGTKVKSKGLPVGDAGHQGG